MKLKKFLASVLCAAMLTAALPALPAAAAGSFPDIQDATVSEAAEFLRLLGILNGFEDGTYRPNESLTRAQFCRLAVDLRGEGAQAAAYERYTYFTDVKGDHWARGYINYASRIVIGENERLVAGVGDGSFEPDRAITQAEAVTMTLRLLGYTQRDVGMGGLHWYDGYMATARTLGLLKDIAVDGDKALDRGSAALLFRNLLYATPKAGGETFFATLGGKITDEVILLSVDATTQDGTAGAIMVRVGDLVNTYKTDHAPFDATLCGTRVTLIQDKDGKILDMKPSPVGAVRRVALAAHEATYLTSAAGDRYTVSADTAFLCAGTKTTYNEVYMDLKAGSELTLSYDVTGKLEYIYMSTTAEEELAQAVTRVTCVYEEASPSPSTPRIATVLNGVKLTVLPQATEELAAFKPGEAVTLFLTADGKIAGAAKPSNDLRSTLVGVVTGFNEGSGGNSATATVETVMTNDKGEKFVFSGEVSSSVERLKGQLVTISSSRSGSLTLTAVQSAAAAGPLNVAQRTLNGQPLSNGVALYERTAGGDPEPIEWSQITVESIPAAKISYVGTDLSGNIDIIVLNDVTGDGYTYGYMTSDQRERTVDPLDPWMEIDNPNFNPSLPEDEDNPRKITVSAPRSVYYEYYIIVENSSGEHELRTLYTSQIRTKPAGMAAGANGRVGGTVDLTAVEGVSRSAFNVSAMTVTVNGVTYPIAKNVECYNRATGTWFGAGSAGLNAARAYAETMTLYYDKAPAQGGKIRLIVVG